MSSGNGGRHYGGKDMRSLFLKWGKPVKIVDLAVRMIELAGYKPNKILKYNLQDYDRVKNCMKRS